VEQLEQRALLASKPLAIIDGVFPASGRSASVSIERASTSLKPLSLSVASKRPDASNPLDEVVVHAQPGATVSLKERGVTVSSATVNRTGEVELAAPLLVGRNDLKAVVTDRFGQRVVKPMTLVRGAPSSYFGAAFQPYVGQWTGTPPNASVPLFNSYDTGDDSVANQIDLIAPQFASISTYSAGYSSYYSPSKPYNTVDSNWMVGGVAAAYNQRQGALKLTVSQGIYQQLVPYTTNFNLPLMVAEANGAISIAKAANAVYAGTVTRLIFTNEFVHDAATTQAVDNFITQPQGDQSMSYLEQAHKLGLEVGVRSDSFGQLTMQNSPYLPQLQQLVKNVDFIMLNLYPSNVATETAQQGLADVTTEYDKILKAARELNPNIQVIISETGWASQGVSFNSKVNGKLSDQGNTLANEQAYFQAVQAWANQNRVETDWFEAIDEPWKSNQNDTSNIGFNGPNGAEGHYGLWTYNSSGTDGQFIQKFKPI
jgi:exo-beta-1,3-glucanase (GH17 family)